MKTCRVVLLAGFFLMFIVSDLPVFCQTEIVSVAKSPEVLKKLRALDFDLLMEREGRVFIVAKAGDLFSLEREGIAFEVETAHFPPPIPRPGSASLQGGINGDYHSYGELESELMNLESSYPEIAKLFDIGDSLEKRNIYALKVSDNVQLDEDEAEVLLLGCHHAREWISVEVPFLFAKYLVENYGSDPEVKSLVDSSEVWIVPLVNPDGLEYTIHFYRYWRKNRRDNGGGNYGVDINRNYDYAWGYDDEGSSPSPSSEVFRGTSSFSEPETQAVRDLFLSKDFRAMITYHSYSQVILYPWGYTKSPPEKVDTLEKLARDMSDLIQDVRGYRYEYGQAGAALYLTNGDTTDWTFGMTGCLSFTIELPPVDQLHGGFFNAERDIQPIFQENLPALLALIRYSIENHAYPGELHKGKEGKTLPSPRNTGKEKD